MATRPTPRQVSHAKQAAEDVNATDVPPTPEEPDSLQSLLSELAGSATGKITVYRTGPNQKQTYVFQCAPEAFSLDDLRDRFNGGDFRLYITRNGVLWKNMTVSVEPKQSGTSPEAPPSSSDAVLAIMREGFQKQAEVMRELVMRTAAPAPAPVSPLAGMNIPELVTSLATLMRTLAPPQPAANPNQGIELLLKGVELAQTLKEGGGGEEPSLMGLMRDLIKSPLAAQAIAATMQQQTQPQPRPAAPRPQPGAPAIPHQPAPQPTAAPAPSFAGETPPPAQPETDSVNPILKHYLGMLVSKAENGADPTLYADLVLDNLTEGQLNQLLDAQPSTVDYLIGIEPRVATQRDWFTVMVNTIALALEPDEEAQSHIQPTGTANASQPTTPDVPGGTANG